MRFMVYGIYFLFKFVLTVPFYGTSQRMDCEILGEKIKTIREFYRGPGKGEKWWTAARLVESWLAGYPTCILYPSYCHHHYHLLALYLPMDLQP